MEGKILAMLNKENSISDADPFCGMGLGKRMGAAISSWSIAK